LFVWERKHDEPNENKALVNPADRMEGREVSINFFNLQASDEDQ
jgi:hypothetical protein